MKTFLIILIFLLAVILQTTTVSLNLVLVLALILVAFKDFKQLWPVILLAGLFLDLFSGLPFGLIGLSLVTTAYLIDLFNRNIFSTIRVWIILSLIVLGTLIYNLFLIGLASIFQLDLFIGFSYLLVEIIYNSLVAIIFFYAFKKLLYQK